MVQTDRFRFFYRQHSPFPKNLQAVGDDQSPILFRLSVLALACKLSRLADSLVLDRRPQHVPGVRYRAAPLPDMRLHDIAADRHAHDYRIRWAKTMRVEGDASKQQEGHRIVAAPVTHNMYPWQTVL